MTRPNPKLDREEREILKAYERGELKPVSVETWERIWPHLRASQRKTERVNIRIPIEDLIGMRQRASLEGIPYQTLMSSVIHKYLSGRLVDKSA